MAAATAIKTASPFETVLGSEFHHLAAPVRQLRRLDGEVTVSGLADVTVDPGILPWLICKLGGLPRTGRDVPVTVKFTPDGRGGEHWDRRFGDWRYTSRLCAARSQNSVLLIEHLGPCTLFFRLTRRGDSLDWRLVRWRFLGVPMPSWTLPTVACTESADGDHLVFDIDAAFPIAGHVIHYRGWLA